ncbi:MAG: HNH endonuclease [Fibrobacter sp.]|nr:HNH endonuclease [Fibrobacter sp.]
MSLTKKKRLEIYEKYGHCCAYCGCYLKYSEMQVDHIKPKCRGSAIVPWDLIGDDVMENYNPSCRMCNFRKGMLTIEQFRDALQNMPSVMAKNFTYRMMLKYGIIGFQGTYASDVATPRITFHFETEEKQRKFQELMRRAENGEGELTITFGGAKLEEIKEDKE